MQFDLTLLICKRSSMYVWLPQWTFCTQISRINGQTVEWQKHWFLSQNKAESKGIHISVRVIRHTHLQESSKKACHAPHRIMTTQPIFYYPGRKHSVPQIMLRFKEIRQPQIVKICIIWAPIIDCSVYCITNFYFFPDFKFGINIIDMQNSMIKQL